MTWTQTDRDAVKAAILALSTGQRAVNVQFADGKRVTYGEASLPELRDLLREIEAGVKAASSKPVKTFRFLPSSGY